MFIEWDPPSGWIRHHVINMDDPKTDEDRRARKKEIQRLIRSRLTRNQRIVLSIFDIAMVAMLLTDIAYFMEYLKEPNLMQLALLNLSVVALGYASYRVKRGIGMMVMREMQGEKEGDAPDADEENPQTRQPKETDEPHPDMERPPDKDPEPDAV